MATDFRALCAELLAHAERAQSVAAQGLWFGDEDDGLFAQARAALADGPAVSDDREPASIDASLAIRVQRLEAMRETEKAALLDAFRQIDELKQRIDFQYFKIHRIEDSLPTTAQTTDD